MTYYRVEIEGAILDWLPLLETGSLEEAESRFARTASSEPARLVRVQVEETILKREGGKP